MSAGPSKPSPGSEEESEDTATSSPVQSVLKNRPQCVLSFFEGDGVVFAFHTCINSYSVLFLIRPLIVLRASKVYLFTFTLFVLRNGNIDIPDSDHVLSYVFH